MMTHKTWPSSPHFHCRLRIETLRTLKFDILLPRLVRMKAFIAQEQTCDELSTRILQSDVLH